MTARGLAFLVALFSGSACADRFDEWDKNKDGKLQKEELPARLRGNFGRADTDRDGVISREEDASFQERRSSPGRPDGVAGNDAFRILKDLDYAGSGNPRQALDLFLPRQAAAKPRPLLVFIHGGAWRGGSKEGGLRRLLPFLQSGDYAGAALNYRLTAEARWPAQIHDCKAALRWLKAHAGEYGYDAARIAVWGDSAGGHLVAMLGVSGDVPELEGTVGRHLDQDSKVTCVVDFFGPANLLTMDDHPSKINHGAAGSPEGALVGGALADRKETARNASPVTHVSRVDAPVLIAHGTEDMLVPYMQSVEFAKVLREADVPVVLITMEGAGHGFRSEELQRWVTAFLGSHLRGTKAVLSDRKIPKGE